MNNKSVRPTGDTIEICEEELQAAVLENDGIIFAMIATIDGFDVASATATGWDISANRLAAMASSGHALGDTVAGELTDTRCSNVIIDTERLSIVFLAVPEVEKPPLLVGVAATKSASLGTVLYGAGRCARQLSDRLTAVPETAA